MDENMNMTPPADNLEKETDVQGTEGEKKLFTQEEVNGFIQSRISRLKNQVSKEVRAEYDQKMAELQAREMKLAVNEKLAEREMPRELADIITCTDENDIDIKLDALQRIYGNKKQASAQAGFIQVGSGGNTDPLPRTDPIRKAMGLR